MTRRYRLVFMLLAALLGFSTQVSAQEGDRTIEGTARHGYYFTSRPHVSLFIYCGFRGGNDQEVFVFQKSRKGNDWTRVGSCNNANAKGSDSVAVGDATMHFIFVVRKEMSSTPERGSGGTSTITNEASNSCGVRLRYAEASGKVVRLVLLDNRMAFGHGVPITKVCDPLLDHYDHF